MGLEDLTFQQLVVGSAEVCCRVPVLRTAAGHLQGNCLCSGLFSCFVQGVETVVLLTTHMPVHRPCFLKEEVSEEMGAFFNSWPFVSHVVPMQIGLLAWISVMKEITFRDPENCVSHKE